MVAMNTVRMLKQDIYRKTKRINDFIVVEMNSVGLLN